jgi:DNA-binding transcriptional ArsR family regulator/uncharacterized protein YndB with AHSA1/START domain
MAARRHDDRLDLAFRALADPNRRALLDSLNSRDGQTLGELCDTLEIARQSVSKHLTVLEEANLLSTVWRGREKLHYLNAEPINAISERWIDHYDRRRARSLADLKRALEETPMERPEFVYTTYIETTPELVWRAITDPGFCREYLALSSDWEVGSTYVWDQDGLEIAHPDQVVVESEPYRRLAFTFHTFVPELAEVTRLEPETIAAAAAEPRSKVTFEIEPRDDGQVKLTVIHDGLEPGGTVIGLISEGWPIKLSILKTLLEREGAAARG